MANLGVLIKFCVYVREREWDSEGENDLAFS